MLVYLDYAATAFQKPESVYQAMDQANRHFSVNAGRGSYGLAREAERNIKETKELLKEIFGAAQSAEVVFTASATLAFNALIGGVDWRKEDVVYVTPYEHNAVMRTLHAYQEICGFRIEELPLKADLSIDLQKTAYCFAKTPPDYLFINGVSNVTGYVLPTGELCREAKKYGCVTVVDGAQTLGAVPFSLKDVDADFLVFAGHKALYGPFGIGGYLNVCGKRLKKVFTGGTGSDSLNLDMPQGLEGYEPGSPNITAVMGLRAALQEIKTAQSRESYWKQEQKLILELKTMLSHVSGLRLYEAPGQAVQAGILSVNLDGYTAPEIGRILDEEFEIAVRTGYHCAPLIHKYLQDEGSGGTVRISIGRFTTEEELQKIAEALEEI